MMTDNFDPNDDMSWLDDTNDRSSDDLGAAFGADDLLPDWGLSDDAFNPLIPGAGASMEDDFDALFGGNADDLTGVADPESPAVITDEIPAWLQASAPDPAVPSTDDLAQLAAPDSPEGVPAWLDTQEMEAAPVANKEDVPPWLAEADETAEEVIAQAEERAKAMPAVAPGDAESFLPPWLQDADDLGAADANAFEASFDSLEFDVDESAAPLSMGGDFSDPFAMVSAPSSGEDMPEWLRTREQPPMVAQDDELAMFLSQDLPGDDTEDLLGNLLGGGSDAPDIDLLSLLEKVDNEGAAVKTGMLVSGTTPPPDDGLQDLEMPDFDALMTEETPPPATPYSPILDEPSAPADPELDLAALFGEPQAEPLPPLDDIPAPPPAAPRSAMSAVTPPAPKPASTDSEYDAFLDSLRGDDWEDLPPVSSEPLDLARLLNDPALDKPSDPRAIIASSELDEPVLPEFLRGVSVSDASAASLLRQQQDVPLDELSDELRALHDELAAIGTAAAAAAPAALPILQPADALPRPAVGLNDAQRRAAELLRSLTVVSAGGDDPAAVVRATQARAGRRRLLSNVVRLAVVSLILLAFIAPFISDAGVLRFAAPPPQAFVPNSTAANAYGLIEELPRGALVLVSVDYSPGAIGELDALTTQVVRHVFARGAVPVVIGSDAVTLQHVGRLVDEMAGRRRQRNDEYVIGRYLLGEAVGTQAFVRNLGSLLRRDIDGLPTGLDVTSIDDFASIIVLTDRSDTVRVWAEQVQVQTRVPLSYAVGVGAAPLSRPYVRADGRLLVGLRDAMTYAYQLDQRYRTTAAPASVTATLQNRWYGVSLGAVVVLGLVVLGSFAGIVQIIFRRRR